MSRGPRRPLLPPALLSGLVLVLGGLAAPALAGAVAPPARAAQTGCSGTSTIGFSLVNDGSKAKIAVQIAGQQTGQRWTYTLKDAGTVIDRGTRSTAGAQKRFTVHKNVASSRSGDVFTFMATHGKETCHATIGKHVAPAGPSCSGRSGSGISVSRLDATHLLFESYIESTHAGQRWAWSVTHDDASIASGHSTTRGREGVFTVKRHVTDMQGTDRFVFRAHHGSEHCLLRISSGSS